jgi:alpha-tubulin suppressor-like RCC1 family protein
VFSHIQIEAFKGEQISKVAAGQQHSLALSIRGDAVFAWGRSDYGQLGLTNEKQSAGSMETTPKQVAFPKTVGDMRIKDIAVGPLLSMAIMDNNDVYSWGFAETGATGHLTDEDGADIVRPKKLEVLQKYSDNQHQGTNCHVHNISGGGQHTLMVIKRFT